MKNCLLQIAAYDGEKTFDIYSVPTVPIKSKATEKTGLVIKQGELYCRGTKVDSVSREAVLVMFLEYLENIKKNNSSVEPCQIILVRHNVIK